jgi:hypothetical protein
MPGPQAGAFAPLLVLLVVLASDAWVYADAKAHTERGTPVIVSAGNLVVETPTAWFVGTLLLWIVFFPLYLVARQGGAG